MLGFGEESQRLLSTFLTYRNDIDIYTEDEEKDKEFYKSLLKKLLHHHIKISDVTPLGCKSNVIKQCILEPENGRKKLFVVDGDINLLHKLNIPSLPNLFVLDAYCIENLLLDEETIIQFIYINCAIKSLEVIADEVDFQSWTHMYTQPLIDLFIHFALVDLFGGKFELFNLNRFNGVIAGEIAFDPNLINDEINKLKVYILSIKPIEDYEYNLEILKTRWRYTTENLLKIVSGKDYLIPMLLTKTQKFKKSKALPSLAEVKMMLVQMSTLNKLRPLKIRLESL